MIRFLSDIIPSTGDQMLDKTNRLTANTVALLGVYGIAFFIVDYTMGFTYTSLTNLLLTPLAISTLFLLSKGKTLAAKVSVIIGCGLNISFLNLMYIPNTAILCFYIPLLLSLQVIFQEKERHISRFLFILGVIAFVFLLFLDFRFSFAYDLDYEGIKYQAGLNLSGALLFSLMLTNFIQNVNNNISKKLYKQGIELMANNKLLNATLKTKDKLIEVVSHDLRSPFLAIEASIEILSDPKTDEEDRDLVLKSLNRKSETTLALLNNLLFWSQGQTDSIKFEPEPIYLEELEASVNGVLRILAEEKKLSLNINFEPGVAVFADRNMLDSIIRNLISNAVKFSNNGSSIELTGKYGEGSVVFTVEDHGVGMSEHVVKKLRQKTPFTIDGTSNESGHGIGLVLVHQFISAHDSILEVSSEKGIGTIFQFKIKAVSG